MGRKLLYLLLGATGAAVAVAAVRCRSIAPRDAASRSDHYDGRRFRNLNGFEQRPFDFLRWQLTRQPGSWPDWIDAAPGAPPPARVQEGIRITFVNHATMLIQMDGVNVLTDPIWSERCSPVSWAGPRRRRPPGIRFEDLPPIDLIVLSHNHYDHLDLPTLRRLNERDRPTVFAGKGNRQLLDRGGIRGDLVELDWWESAAAHGLALHFVRARHFSARGPCDRDAALWGGWVISGASGRVYFAGDTGWDDHFAEIRTRIGPPDVALLPIGAFRPRWFMSPVHISPDEAIDAHRALGAAMTIPMHYGTFFLGDDGETEPVDDLRRSLAEQDMENEFTILDHGEAIVAWRRDRDEPATRPASRG